MRLSYYPKYLLFIILFTSSFSLRAQNVQNQPLQDELPNPFQVVKRYVEQNNYITPIFELKAQEEKYLASPRWKRVYLEMIILLQSYVGDYEEAYRYDNILQQDEPVNKRVRELNAQDITQSPVADYKMLDALDAMEAVAGKHRVIMINEEHRTPFHRALTLQLLAKLYRQGFRYFAAETLFDTDTEINRRGYPVQKTGFYTADPVYADAIRTALKLGYKIVPYEDYLPECQSPDDNPGFCNDQRERGQAKNLYERILKTDPQAKIFVHVGRSHNQKNASSKKFNFMGYYFKEISGIEPFTINQVRFSQRPDTTLEQPLYRFLTNNKVLRNPSVFQSTDGKFYNVGFGYDMEIFHPRIKYESGRPTFLKTGLMRKPEKINLKKLNLKSRNQTFGGQKLILIQAFYAQESADAIPIDQIILHPKQPLAALMLPKGDFRIRAINEAGKALGQYETKSK